MNVKIQPIKWLKILLNHISDKGLYPEYIKDSDNLVTRTQLNLKLDK